MFLFITYEYSDIHTTTPRKVNEVFAGNIADWIIDTLEAVGDKEFDNHVLLFAKEITEEEYRILKGILD